MNGTAIKLGFWSAGLAAVTFLVYTICFVAVFVDNPPPIWRSLIDYLEYVQQRDQALKFIAPLSMLLFTPLYVVLVNSIHELAPAEKRVLSRLALIFGVLFAVLVGLFHFVQVTTVRWHVDRGTLQGIEQLVQARPDSVLVAVNMLGWTLFFGLSSLFAATVFVGSRLAAAIRALFILNAIFCLVGGISFVFAPANLVFFTIILGMGGTVTAVTVLLAIFFHRLGRKHAAKP